MFDKFDCVITPEIEDFDVSGDKDLVVSIVKNIAIQKKFEVVINQQRHFTAKGLE